MMREPSIIHFSAALVQLSSYLAAYNVVAKLDPLTRQGPVAGHGRFRHGRRHRVAEVLVRKLHTSGTRHYEEAPHERSV